MSSCTEDGATLVEYSLLVALVAVALIVVVTAFGTSLNGLVCFVLDEFAAVGIGSGCPS